MTEKMFFNLFGKQRPSVKLFYKLLEGKTPEGKDAYYQYAYFLFMNRYHTLSKWYRRFLTTLVKHDWQRFFDYLMQTSGFSSLRGGIKNHHTFARLLHMLMADKENVITTYEQMAFFTMLSFDITLNINTLSSKIRQIQFTPETFFELAEHVGIYL